MSDDGMARLTVRLPDGMKAELRELAEEHPMFEDMSDIGRAALREFLIDRAEVVGDD
jgi:Arc/MetJ-type ribon-helix-helix transcriptional regulator